MLLYKAIAARYTAAECMSVCCQALRPCSRVGNRPQRSQKGAAKRPDTALCRSNVRMHQSVSRQPCGRMTSHQDNATSSSSSPVPSADPPAQLPEASPEKPAVKGKPKKEYRQIQMPSAEQIVQEDMMNNCGIRTVMSGVMGMGLGVLFGVVMGTMDAGVSLYTSVFDP